MSKMYKRRLYQYRYRQHENDKTSILHANADF